MSDDEFLYYTLEDDDEYSESLINIPTGQNVFNKTSLPSTSNRTENNSSNIYLENKKCEEKVVWLEKETKLLMALYHEYRPKVGKSLKLKTKKKMWEAIEEAMIMKGYKYNALQIENKFKSLERSFKKKIQHNNKTGRDRASCSYEKEMDEIFKGRDNIFPQYILGAAKEGLTQKEQQNRVGIEETLPETPENMESENMPEINSNCSMEGNTSQRSEIMKKVENKSVVRELSLLRQQKREYYEKHLDYQTKKLNAYEKRTHELAEKNALLKDLIGILSKKE